MCDQWFWKNSNACFGKAFALWSHSCYCLRYTDSKVSLDYTEYTWFGIASILLLASDVP
jgi:hypothetical protein